MRRSRRSRRGFSIYDIVCSMLVIGIGIGGLLSGANQLRRGQIKLERKDQAIRVVDNALERARPAGALELTSLRKLLAAEAAHAPLSLTPSCERKGGGLLITVRDRRDTTVFELEVPGS